MSKDSLRWPTFIHLLTASQYVVQYNPFLMEDEMINLVIGA